MNKITIGVIIAVIAAFGGLLIYTTTRTEKTDYSVYDAGKIINDPEKSGNIAEHVRGKADSKVVLVEYTDFQCPGCASMMPKIDELYEELKDKVAFVFRHYPISGHQNARSAAAVAEAAGLQGRFWEMADALYTNRSDWMYETGDSRTEKYVSLFSTTIKDGNVDQFKKDITDNQQLDKKINFDMNIGKEVSKVNATPAFYVNGEAVKIGDNDTLDDLTKNIREKINEELAKN